MSRKSSKSPNQQQAISQAIDRPFSPEIWARARNTVLRYRLILEPSEEVGFVGTALELPGAFADGRTADECVSATREAVATAVATMLEAGQEPPRPASSRRTEQINIRLSAEEKALLEDLARTRGFRGISDFMRAAALERLG